MNIELELKKLIKNVLNDLDLEEDIIIEIPKDRSNGDYSSNVAMKCCKKLGKSPIEIANLVKNNISSDLIESIEIKNPGFINFFVNKTYLFEELKEIIKLENNYGKNNLGEHKKVNIEFVSVNPTGTIHLGHARGACIGDSLANILSFNGYDVTKEYYINDAGNQMINMALSIYERYKEICGLDSKMEENYYYGKEIIEVAQKMYDEKKDGYLTSDIKVFWKKGLEYFLGGIKKDLANIGVNFDVWTSEQELRDRNLVEKALSKLTSLGYTYEQDGAIFLKTTLFGDEKDRVLVKQDKSYTYFMPDIAYHLDKLNRGYDKLIDVFGADHHGYVSRLKASVTMLGQDADKLSVLLIQMVRAIKNGEEYKISKRTGNTITLNDLVEESGKDAIRYFFTSRSMDTQMDFDIDLAKKNSNENPVFYVNYAHARICSILRNKDYSLKEDYKFETIDSETAYNVLEKLNEFKKVVKKSALKKEPHLITNYVYELATVFHSYYSEEKIVTDNEKYTYERIMLIKAVKIIIANSLNLIGVAPAERM